MNRNNEMHFNQVPMVHASRTRFPMKQDVKTTMNAGKLVPYYVKEILPGDTWDVDLNGIVRMSTPIYPVMDNCYLDTYFFWVPNRIIWNNWKEFMGEVTTDPWVQQGEYTVPKLIYEMASSTSWLPGEQSIADYMGVPTKIITNTNQQMAVNALPFRAYTSIWNEWFRDQNLDNPATMTRESGNQNVKSYANTTYMAKKATTDQLLAAAWTGLTQPLPVNKFHDYFTSALPEPQRGESQSLPLFEMDTWKNNNLWNTTVVNNGKIPILSTPVGKTLSNASYYPYVGEQSAIGTNPNNAYGYGQNITYYYSGGDATTGVKFQPSGSNYAPIGNGGPDYSGSTYAATLEAFTLAENSTLQNALSQNQVILTADISTVRDYMAAATTSAATINQLRQAFAVQQLLERDARGGSRYREQLKVHFNVTISDSTVQIPEYLGGQRYMINVSQVIQTSETNTTPLGETGAISVTPFSGHAFTKSFEEHGFILGLACIRHDRTYQQGLERFWLRNDRLDYYYPVFAHLGEQGIYEQEIYATPKSSASGDVETTMEAQGGEIFGYQEAWADYRMTPNRVSGYFRSNATGSLDAWHYADDYSATPVLSQGWMKEGDTEIARTLATANEEDSPQFIADFLVDAKVTRAMPLYSVPGLDRM